MIYLHYVLIYLGHCQEIHGLGHPKLEAHLHHPHRVDRKVNHQWI
tara:strand:- start:470 stop:604 length:135 start_codon:yes stop_codon:yes gene_type:complete